MAGHGERRSRLQEGAIAALLSAPTQAEAAQQAGVSQRTLRGWLRRPDFLAAYRAARRRVLEDALSRLQAATGQATDTLVRALTCGQTGTEIKAALGILDHAVKAAEWFDLDERLTAVEQWHAEATR
jgi:hypothetical protein